MAAATNQSGSYTAENIQVLEGLEPVRTAARDVHRDHRVPRSAPPRVRGRRQLDRRGAGRVLHPKILVRLLADGGVQVVDNGRGIPVTPSREAKDRQPAVEVVLTTLHAGGKFDGKSYAVSGGLHGVGVSVVNALSERLIVEVARDGFTVAPGVRAGQADRQAAARASRPSKTGTTVTFWPDPEVFTDTVEFKREMLAERLQEQSFLVRGVEIALVDEREEPAGPRRVQGDRGACRTSCKHLAQGKDAAASTQVIHFERARATQRGRRRACSGTTASRNRSTLLLIRSTLTRAACTRRASRRRSRTS